MPAARSFFESGAIGKVSRIEQCRNGSKPYWYSWMERAEAIKAEDVDWKEFLGDRPMRPFDGKLLTGWYGFREFTDGPIANLGCHFIDLFNYIVGSKFPLSCVAQGATFTWKGEDFTCPDHCQASWIYPEGFLVSYASNFGNSNGNVLKIYGDEGTIDLTQVDDAHLFVSRGHQAQQAAQGGYARRAGGNSRPLPRLATVPAHAARRRTRRSRRATTTRVPVIMGALAMDTGKRQIFDPGWPRGFGSFGRREAPRRPPAPDNRQPPAIKQTNRLPPLPDPSVYHGTPPLRFWTVELRI